MNVSWPLSTNSSNVPVVLPTLKYATQKHYRYILDVHLVPVFGKTGLSDIRREWIPVLDLTTLSSVWILANHWIGITC
jgi:hypothetical protein